MVFLVRLNAKTTDKFFQWGRDHVGCKQIQQDYNSNYLRGQLRTVLVNAALADDVIGYLVQYGNSKG